MIIKILGSTLMISAIFIVPGLMLVILLGITELLKLILGLFT